MKADFARFVEAIHERANDLSGGRLEILRRATESFGKARAAQAAAAMAHYAVFSLFPLLLVLASVMSFLWRKSGLVK